MSQNVKGTFVSTQSVATGQTSDVLAIPTSTTTMRLTLAGTVNATNRVRTQRSLDSGQTWGNMVLYNTAQTNVGITVAAGEQWRLVLIQQDALSVLEYSLSAES